MTAKPGLSATGFHHEAFFYAGDDEFLEGAVPYLEEGSLRPGKTVLVVLPEPTPASWCGRHCAAPPRDEVKFWPMGVVGRNPGTADRGLAATSCSTCDPAARASAGSGEPVPAGPQRGGGGRVRAARAAVQPRLRRGASH